MKIYEWACEKIEEAEREGRQIYFDVPFDPDDRYDGIYRKDAGQLAAEIDKRLKEKEENK